MCRGRRGQALLVAVLLMMAILLVGILFVALVTYNQRQSTRHEDVLAAQALAEAGIRYADHMLEQNGADWRPPEPPATYVGGGADVEIWGPDGVPGTDDDYYTEMEMARGWAPELDTTSNAYVRRGYTRYPEPWAPAGLTEPTQSLLMGNGYFLLRVTYNPWEVGDPGTPEPMSNYIRIESIGRVDGTQVYRKLVAYKPLPMLDYGRWVHNATDHDRPAELGSPGIIDMNAGPNAGNEEMDRLRTVYHGPIRVDTTLKLAGSPYLDAGGTIAEASTTLHLLDGPSPSGYLRQDRVLATGGIYRHTEQPDDSDDSGDRPAQVQINNDPPVLMTYTSDDVDPDPDTFDTIGGHVRDGKPGTAAGYPRWVERIEPPTIDLDRYRKLTRDSGDFIEYPPTSGHYVAGGQYGYGAGIYIDNFNDIQYDHDIDRLIDDWMRQNTDTGTPTGDSGWDALFRTYAPPAVEIEFLPNEAAAGDPSAIYTGTDPAGIGEGQVWWPFHEGGQPGIRLTRYDKTWRAPDGSDSLQRTIILDYPTPWLDGTTPDVRHPLIVAEGNVRVSGQLPPALLSGGGELRRAYDMTIVSGGTIYIDGQLLSPNDYIDPDLDPAFNTKVALLARDSVCLNATQIVPQDTLGTAPAVPDDPVNPSDREKHWLLAPGSDGRAYSSWFWGDVPEGDSVALVVRQTAGDPGPSGVALTCWVAGAGSTPYDFGNPPDPMSDYTFALTQPDQPFPDGSLPPQPWGVAAVAPSWAPYDEPAANLPWDLAGYVDSTIGRPNAIMLRHSDPQLGAGSTGYWLKAWKIAEFNSDGLPVGAINARVNASVFAERGCWFVLTSGWFDETASDSPADPDAPDPVRYRRYNYKITFNGTIAENYTAPIEAARDWTDKCAFPAEYTGNTTRDLGRWGTIEYYYDDTLRLTRYHGPVEDPAHPAANLPRMPLLPVGPDLVYYGESR